MAEQKDDSPRRLSVGAARQRRPFERVSRHPLAVEETASTSTVSSMVDAASLIQCTARSIMVDGCSPLHTADSVSCCANGLFTPRSHSHSRNDIHSSLASPSTTASLHSLQQSSLPAFPDEPDRRRFIGCLAAVLARSYAYDMDDREESSPTLTAFFERKESMMEEETILSFGSTGTNPSEHHNTIAADTDTNTSLDCGTNTTWSMQDRTPRESPLHRHRKRRYTVLSQLLLQSADSLRVERSQAKAFLPLLSKLLLPQQSPSPKQQQQQPQPQQQYADAELQDPVGDIQFLEPFLESMTPGSGFRCLAMLLIQHLIQAENGYDCRVRHALKTLGVIVLMNDLRKDPVDIYTQFQHQSRRPNLMAVATRKFESLEQFVARKLWMIAKLQKNNPQATYTKQLPQKKTQVPQQREDQRVDNTDPGIYSRDQMLRHLKIGGTAVVAGTLFAVTGGLAAPGIAAGVAGIMGGTAVTAAAAALLTSTAAVTAIFGVGGGSLAAYKMQRRTQGLTEFEFQKESGKKDDDEAELFSTICISGWLQDNCDFQRPWGVMPTNPRILDRREMLERFYAVYRPDHVAKCSQILDNWKGEEDQLWKLLEQKYGRHPGNLFPLTTGPRFQASLTLEQKELIDQLFVELGVVGPVVEPEETTIMSPFQFVRRAWSKQCRETPTAVYLKPWGHERYQRGDTLDVASETTLTAISTGYESAVSLRSSSSSLTNKDESKGDASLPKHLATVWDYSANYGGELYTVRWESGLLTELCDSIHDLAMELVTSGTTQLLKHTALNTLLSAFVWPYALVNAANMIDGTWTLAVERADEAGKELARSLLCSSAGSRPVTLIGYSFGSRAVYSCLKELARYQEAWEDNEEDSHLHRCRSINEPRDGGITLSREPASIVEDAILMGLPNHLSLSSWQACRQVVAGRLVNCYSQKDLILSLMFQLKRFKALKPVCGTVPVPVPGVENIDVSDIISGHQDYCVYTGDILKRVRLGQPFESTHHKETHKELHESVPKLDI